MPLRNEKKKVQEFYNDITDTNELVRTTLNSLSVKSAEPSTGVVLDAYTLVLDKALQNVAEKDQIDCMIEIFQVIKRFKNNDI